MGGLENGSKGDRRSGEPEEPAAGAGRDQRDLCAALYLLREISHRTEPRDALISELIKACITQKQEAGDE